MAPPPPPPPPPRRSPLLKFIIIAIIAIIILLGLIALIIWLSVRPRNLRYSIEDASITGYNLTKDHLNAKLYFLLKAENPNKRISIYYDKIDVTVSYEDQKLAVNNVHPFYQRRRNVTNLDLNLVAKDAFVYGPAARDLCDERASGDVGLDLKIKAQIRMKVGAFKIHRTLEAECEKLNVPFDKTKKFERVICDVDIDD